MAWTRSNHPPHFCVRAAPGHGGSSTPPVGWKVWQWTDSPVRHGGNPAAVIDRPASRSARTTVSGAMTVAGKGDRIAATARIVMITPEAMTAISVVIGLAVTSVPGTVALGAIEAALGGPSAMIGNATTGLIGTTVRTEAMTPTVATGPTEATVRTVTTGQVVTVRTVVTVAARSTGHAVTTGQHTTAARLESGTSGTGADPTRVIVPGVMTVVPTNTAPVTAPTAGRTGSVTTVTATSLGMVVRGGLTGSSAVARPTGPVGTTGRGVTIGWAAAMPEPRIASTGASPNEPRIGLGRSPIARSAPIVMPAQLGVTVPPRAGTAVPRTVSAGRPRGSIGRIARVASSAAIRAMVRMIVSGSPLRRCPRVSSPSSWTRRCVGISSACARRSLRR
jgi:hypothetical protein